MGLRPARKQAAPSPAARLAVSLPLAILAIGAGAAESRAQVVQPARDAYRALVLQAPASVEAAAYGNAPHLRGGGADLLFYAPALIGRAGGMAAGLHRYGSEGTVATLASEGSVGLGDFAVGLQYMRYGGSGTATLPDLQYAAFADGEPVTEFAASFGYARTLFGVVDAGVVAKYLELHSLHALRDRALVADLGVAREFGPAMVSLTARNLGSDLETRAVTDSADRIPTQLALGISTESFEVGELDMFLTSQVARRRDGEIIPAGGVEISYWPVQGYTFRLRAGLQRVVEDRRSPFTFGLAFTGDALTLEYAFQAFHVDGNAHRFGLTFR
ncbi:MAG: hypothetical protein F4164_04105 [Gemmatimonadales bacterium]|nr:hypothetical protein [Gemmatimonadales bacterium]MYG48559.1 hypothetical protein [Gemmatimonadales bacterium]MYK03080.1 hypothetical protein [Candidatus Palauibacter ramosifaciens]